MRVAEKATPIAAVIAALSTIACCLPFGFLGAVGLAGASLWLARFRGWLLVIAGLLLVFGFWQLYRPSGTCRARSRSSIAILWVAAILVVAVILLPQLVANIIAR